MKVVADTANGMGGLVVPKVFEGLPFDLTVLFGELDGTFPNHPADPIQVENLKDLQRAVVDGGAEHRPRVRRRRRPGLPRRRSRPARERLDHHRDGREVHAREAPGRDDRLQPDLLARGAGDHPRERRHAGAHARRSLVHQAGDGRDRCGLRRRALRALLLPRQLARRFRIDRGAVRARAALARGTCRCRSSASRSNGTCRAARSTRASPTRW